MAQRKSFFDDVKKELECSVCQELFSEVNEPKILKCLHTFCKNCLEAWLRRQREGQLSCPTCRQITECPNSNINSLPSNLFYKQMVEIVEAYSGTGQADDLLHCGNCVEKKPLNFYCFDCNTFLCEKCAGTHSKSKLFKGHHVKEFGKFESSDVQDYARKSNVCKKHKDELRFYCENCNICICRDCAILEHRDDRNHNIVSLEQGFENKKSDITSKMKDVEAIASRLRDQKQTMEKKKVRMLGSIDQATSEVHRVAEQCISFIRQNQAAMSKKLLEQKNSFQGTFSSQMSRLNEKLVEIDSSLVFSSDVLARENLPEILNVEEILDQRFQELSSEFRVNLNYSCVKYVPNDTSPSMNDVLGKLIFTKTDAMLTIADGKGLTEGTEDEVCYFKIETRDSQRQITYSGVDKVAVDIRSVDTGNVIAPEITDLKNGCYEVKYKPKIAGKFEVCITVDGEPIVDNPFGLEVKEKRRQDKLSGYLQTQHLVQVLDNDVKLSLYKGDITEEAVDAIVNAANQRLQHGGGVAAAIVRKGGRQIQEESNRIIKRCGTLNVGEAVYTSGGSLSCRYVIHTVGPEWYRHGKDMSRSLLWQACIESLTLAVNLHLSSIALTAISSGIFGMPKDTCAEVMFLAIEEFSSSGGAKFSTLRDVRIVIIDEPTLSVFQEEFAKRYVAHEASPETLSTQGRSSDGQESTSAAPNSKDSAHQSKRNDSSPSTGQAQFGDKAFSGEKREQNGDVGSPSVPTNPEEVGQSSTTPDSVNESGKNGYKDNLSTGQLNKDEENCNSGVKDPASVVDPVKYKESNARPSFSGKGRGRERGNLAANFSGNETAKNATRGTNLGIKSSEISKGGAPPPGLIVTQEGKTLAKSLNVHGAGDQKSNVDDTGKAKIAEDEDEPSSDNLQNAKQVQNLANQSFDSENSKIEAGDGDRTDHTPNTSSREGSNKPSNNKDASNDKQRPQQLKEEGFSTPGMKTEQKSEQPTNPALNDNNEAFSPQDEVIIRSTKPEETQSAMESTPEDDPSASCLSPSSDHSFSNQDVTDVDKDKVGERRDAQESENQDHATGPPMLLEGQNGHQSGQRCLMGMNLHNDTVFLWRCGSNHHYCKSCSDFLDGAGICPKCRKEGLRQGNQPVGSMVWVTEPNSSLPGYDSCGIIVTRFNFDEGIQGPEHSNPGKPYKALSTTAFLPLNSDGKEVCFLLRKAFDAGVLFAIGKSPTTGEENNIIWNGVELKTSQSGGPASYGYPDPSYIDRVKKQLAEKGITPSQE